ncbi:hypothetical protein KAU39_05310 [bacterium]|nr:hypothetical protein [bacterium]
MCVPISVVTEGKVSGCHGVCRILPHLGALVTLGVALIWNYRFFGLNKLKVFRKK